MTPPADLASRALAARTALLALCDALAALTPTPAPVAPPAGKYEPRVGDFVTWGSCTAMWRVLRVDSGGVYAVLAEKRNYTTEPRYLDPSERETLRPATPSELAAAGLAVPPPATTPVPEVLTPDVPEGSTIAQLAAEQRASMGLTASMGSTQHFTHAATPAPEAKRPTHVRTTREIPSWSGGDRIEAGVVLPVKEGPLPSGSVWVRVGSRPAFILHRDEWEPAPCPPPVAGRGEKDEAVRGLVAFAARVSDTLRLDGTKRNADLVTEAGRLVALAREAGLCEGGSK